MTEKTDDYFQVMQRHFGMWGRQGQTDIRDSVVAVGGVGGIGAISALMLVKAGVGKIVLCDRDAYGVENIVEQAFATYDTVGKEKVEAAKTEMKRHTQHSHIQGFSGDLSRLGTAKRLVEEADILVSGVDNAVARMTLGRAAEEKQIPMVVSANVGWSVLHTVYFPGEHNYGSVWQDVEGITWSNGFPDMTDQPTRRAVEKEWNIWVAALSRYEPEALRTFVEEDPSYYWYAAPPANFAASLGIMDVYKMITGKGDVCRFPDVLYHDMKSGQMLSWGVLRKRRDELREVWGEEFESILRTIESWNDG